MTMKTLPAYYKGSQQVNAYTQTELAAMEPVFTRATNAWYEAAKGQDEGTSVLGAGLVVWYARPRARYAREELVVRAPAQGNVTNYKTHEVALKILREAGIEAEYYDGNLD